MHIAVVEDESIFRDQIIGFFKNYQDKYKIEVKSVSYINGQDFIDSYTGQFDAVFMDIIMPKMGGMEAARLLRQKDEDIPLIFMTNVAQYAIEGYKVNALDFMIKPVTFNDIEMKLNKILYYQKKFGSCSIMLTSDGISKMISIRDIYYIEVFNHNLIYHTVLGDFTRRGQLSELTSSAKFAGFVRSNSCYLVNCYHIKGLDGDDLIVNDKRLSVSRRRRKELLQVLAEYIGGRA